MKSKQDLLADSRDVVRRISMSSKELDALLEAAMEFHPSELETLWKVQDERNAAIARVAELERRGNTEGGTFGKGGTLGVMAREQAKSVLSWLSGAEHQYTSAEGCTTLRVILPKPLLEVLVAHLCVVAGIDNPPKARP